MNNLHGKAYSAAFIEYIRRGTPIHLTLKETELLDRYVWRTQRDNRVRRSHRENEGRIFSWSDPLATGHPGEDYNCRCEAIPYLPGETEFAFHDFTTSLTSTHDRWNTFDLVWHYYRGGGRAVDLREIGHLREIAEHYAYELGVFRKLSGQIANAARNQGSGVCDYVFENAYDFDPVDFAHGGGEVKGLFLGFVDN